MLVTTAVGLLVVKAAVIIVILVLQSPLSARLFRHRPGAQQ